MGVGGSAQTTLVTGSDQGDALIRIDQGPAAIVLEGLTLDGGGGFRNLVGLDADLEGRDLVFTGGVTAGASLPLQGPDLYFVSGTISLEDCAFEDATFAQQGGGHAFLYDTVATFDDVTFLDGDTPDLGGAVLLDSSDLTMIGSLLQGNSAYEGGGLYATLGTHVLVVEDTRFIANQTTRWSAGAHVEGFGNGSGQARFDRTTFDGNVAADNAGGLGGYLLELLQVQDSAFTNNTSRADGGGLWAGWVDQTEVIRTTFDVNTSEFRGGGVLATETLISVVGSSFCGNSSSEGGALSLLSASGLAENNRFQRNDAALWGSSVAVESGYEFEIIDLHHNTLADNGGVLNAAAVDLIGLTQGSMTHNAFVDNDNMAIRSSLGASLSEAYNLFWGAGQEPLSTGNLNDSDLQADPRFVVHTGACDDDLHPAVDSPLIDAGDPLSQDGDGSPPDIGMYGGPLAADRVDVDGDGALLDDCDPYDATVAPGQIEIAGDGVDSDCDGLELCYVDQDGDGLGTDTTLVDGVCGEGFAPVGGDCDDTDPDRGIDCETTGATPSPPDPGIVDAAAGPLPAPWFCGSAAPGPAPWGIGLLALARRRRS